MNTQKAWLSYLFGWITGLIMFLTEKDDKFVKYHAMQSILFSVAIFVFYIVAMILTLVSAVLGAIIYAILGIAILIMWIMSMVKAAKGEWFKWPVIGDMAMKIAGANA